MTLKSTGASPDPYRPKPEDLEDWLTERAAILMDAEGMGEEEATREAARRLVARVGPVAAETKQEWMTAMKARLRAVGGRDGTT